ncbi:acetamidase/formamidase family protein [Bradyrhizobium hipponense]|uniref:Acetamidase/formamidase family protein n=1 Tax=Bradyrhizobium hipponense TaxID=2605638 RepID=A0A5S4YTD9_9BRAD|nr:acetamidase/formamidase family protein [Bradyrhizobium hipponense]TYO66747.1 acetamidase/formamidase family protein [Bradyrhizobium hipponense]
MDFVLRSTPGNVQWGLWDGRLKPVLRIASGDRVTIETLSGEPDDLPDSSLGFDIVPGHADVLASTFRGPGPHLLTGPIHIEGAEPGDVLEVRVLNIELRCNWGWNLQVPMLGTLPEDFPELRRIHIPLDRARNVAKLPWGQELPLAPFFGNFGVAPPPAWGRLSSKEPRAFGGNMDNKELGAGSTVYFPVFVPGALFSAGDGHALQGDGEVCLTAIEAALTGTFEFHVRRDLRLASPRAETASDWITMGFDEDLDDAAKAALRDMIALIREHSGLGAQDAYTLCSIAADLRVTQMVDGNKGIHCVLAKSRMP